MKINYNSKSKPRKIIYTLISLGVLILAISWCKKEPPNSPKNGLKGTLQSPSPTPSRQPGYDLALASLDNSKSFLLDFEVRILPDYTFKLRRKKGSEIKGEYQVDSLNNVILFNSNGFKDTFSVRYFSSENSPIKGFYSNKFNRSFSPKEHHCQLDLPNALQQIYLIKWQYSEDDQGQGFLTLNNYGKTTLDSIVICINGDFFDGHYRIEKNFETHEYRWPQREGTWARVDLAPGKTLKVNLFEAVNPDGKRFKHTLLAVTKVCCVGKISCDGNTATTEIMQLPPADD